MAQKEGNCLLGKGGIPSAFLHRLEGRHTPTGGEEEAEVAQKGRVTQKNTLKLEPWHHTLEFKTCRPLESDNI